MNKNKIIIYLLLIVIVTGFIFSNSFKDIEQSNNSSDIFAEILEPIIKTVFGADADVNFIVRKGAHITEFFVLGFLVMLAVGELKKKIHGLTGIALFYVLSVAVTDEFIQSFFDRTSSVSDVIIDFSGALLGFIGYVFLNCCVVVVSRMLLNKVKKGKDHVRNN